MKLHAPIFKSAGIYEIYCQATGKCYIGRSSNIGVRVDSHFYILRKGTHYNHEFQSDFARYGISSFSVKVLEETEDISRRNLINLEQKHLNLRVDRDLYTKRNANVGAFSGEISEESRKKMSERQVGEKNHFYGKRHSAEHRQRLRENNPSSDPATGRKIAAAHTGRRKMFDLEGKDRRVKQEEVEQRLKEGWMF